MSQGEREYGGEKKFEGGISEERNLRERRLGFSPNQGGGGDKSLGKGNSLNETREGFKLSDHFALSSSSRRKREAVRGTLTLSLMEGKPSTPGRKTIGLEGSLSRKKRGTDFRREAHTLNGVGN